MAIASPFQVTSPLPADDVAGGSRAMLLLLAHEIRGPLSPLRCAVSLLRRAGAGADFSREAADLVERQVNVISTLIDDVLEAAIRGGTDLPIRFSRLDLRDVVHRVAQDVRPMLDERGHELHVVSTRRPLLVNGDGFRLAQVMVNLLGNAAKYTDRGGHIGLRLEREYERVTITVTDDGIGLSETQLASIFDLYAQAGQAGAPRAAGGLGIGLHLARRIVKAHGGTLSAASAGAGQGSTFVVSLPAPPGD